MSDAMWGLTTHPDTGEQVKCLLIPEGHVVCVMPREQVEQFAQWAECCAVRVAVDEDGTGARLQVTNDLEWVTGPEADHAA